MIELEIENHLPDRAASTLNSVAEMEYFGQRVREAHRERVDYENLDAVRFESVFYEDQLSLFSAVWLIKAGQALC